MPSVIIAAMMYWLVLAAAVAASSEPSAASIAGRLDAYTRAAANLGRFSGVVLTARGGDVARSAHGFADMATRTPIRVDSQFEIASLTKMFTAAAILRLRDAGKLRLDDPLCTYLASCPAAWRPVTIDQVLHHRSGIPDYEDALDMESPAYYAALTAPNDAQRLLEREMALPLDFAPGSKFAYSNTGYLALGFAIQAASHETYAAYLRETLFGPAGMHDTGILGVDRAPRLVTGYAAPAVSWNQRLPGFKFEDVALTPVPKLTLAPPHGDGSVFSTADDLLRWARVMVGSMPSLEPASERTEILRAVDGYGDGWMVGPALGQRHWFHTGELPGFLSNIAIFPDSGTIVVVLDNVDVPMGNFVRDVQAIALGLPYDMPFSGAMTTLDAAQNARFEGRYRAENGDIVCVAHSKDMLEAAIKGRYTAGLLPFAEGGFFMPLGAGLVTFEPASGDRATSLNLHYGGVDHRATRTDAACPEGTLL